MTIVGGGYSGAALAVQLVRASRRALDIAIVEPRAVVGPGLAYATDDPDHRLNGSLDNHAIDAREPGELSRWCEAHGVFARDPEARWADGSVFIRRGDFGAYLAAAVREHAAWPATGSTIRHVRAVALDALPEGAAVNVLTSQDGALPSDMVVVATGNALPRPPAPFSPALDEHPAVIASPFDSARVYSVAKSARVLVVGGGLTALDIISTLVRRGHRGPVTVISRRGLRPRPHRPPATVVPGAPTLLERIEGALPPFVAALGPSPSVRRLLHALREHIRSAELAGAGWHGAFDDLRDGVRQVWPALAIDEKRRFLRQLRPWYDAHRFRAPPQNAALVRTAEQRGQVRFRAARARWARAAEGGAIEVGLVPRDGTREVTEAFDVAINCTGLDGATGARDNPFLAALVARGALTLDPSGMGFAVDRECRAIDSAGRHRDTLRVIGPPSAGSHGDPLGVIFIAAQIRRVLPGLIAALEGG